MSAPAVTERRPVARRSREADCRSWPGPEAGPGPAALPALEAGPTLDDVVSRAWEVLRAGLPVACLVCGAELAPRPSAGAGVVGGRCGGCGTTLA